MSSARNPLAALRAAAAARQASGLARALAPRPAGPDPLTDLASNDYLGLSRDPRVTERAAAAAREWGAGATGSRLVTGSTDLHAALERELAEFAGTRAALVFSSGYLANLAAITALASALGAAVGERAQSAVLIVSDAANHASLVDACRLARARVEIVAHQDVGAVERALATRAEPGALVVTESAFSVGGQLAPLASLHRAARTHGALLVVDEAHALGVAGPGGAGAARAAGIAGEDDVVLTATMSKSLGAQGGAVLGAPEIIETLISTGRSFIFDTGLAPASVGAALAALAICQAEPDLPERARASARRIAGLAQELGFAVARPGAAVTSVLLGDPVVAVTAQRLCADLGVRVGCFRPPSVPAGGACLRLTGRATLTEREFDNAARALAAVRERLRVQPGGVFSQPRRRPGPARAAPSGQPPTQPPTQPPGAGRTGPPSRPSTSRATAPTAGRS